MADNENTDILASKENLEEHAKKLLTDKFQGPSVDNAIGFVLCGILDQFRRHNDLQEKNHLAFNKVADSLASIAQEMKGYREDHTPRRNMRPLDEAKTMLNPPKR